MSCAKVYTILDTGSPCLLNLQAGNQVVSINLHGATVRQTESSGVFHIQGLNSGAIVSPDSSFTKEDIEDLIASCMSGGSSEPSDVTPSMSTGGNLSVQTAATGTNWTAFASQECKQLTISNDTGTKLEVRQNGAGVGLRIMDNTYYTFFGLTNTNQLSVRRVDTSNTQVTATARWES